MAVYTQITHAQLDALLEDYDLGQLVDFTGIEGGIENSNFFVTLDRAGQHIDYVLTLFEELGQDETPFFVELGQWLQARQVPVPHAIKDRNGIALKQLCGKPAFFQPRFHGHHLDREQISAAHCEEIGAALARFHLAGEDFYLRRQAQRGVFWWRRESQAIRHRLSPEDAELLQQEVALFDTLRERPFGLPLGTIHGDLFHDNALFVDDRLEGILDIYNAATAFLLFDLAIVANDWCTDAQGRVDPRREQALTRAYADVRPFSDEEAAAWPTLTRTAAMRFWLSRLIPWLGIEQAARSGISTKLKDPDEFRRILLQRIAHPASLA
ncbi:homoserine kinase [Marinobacterium weihaiense]|uniref:Homoserine kinase n=1 Tax=Marinobacterium weihaiense TaxID=2851016 RepID=A0ABS6MDS9_9GAMM|nr:homoserine kinase [Marinobacterium weihaiense]MBV0934433.1 homoserine kinase [Marinobacterium weihaiense]